MSILLVGLLALSWNVLLLKAFLLENMIIFENSILSIGAFLNVLVRLVKANIFLCTILNKKSACNFLPGDLYLILLKKLIKQLIEYN